jgi:hypothetical protein
MRFCAYIQLTSPHASHRTLTRVSCLYLILYLPFPLLASSPVSQLIKTSVCREVEPDAEGSGRHREDPTSEAQRRQCWKAKPAFSALKGYNLGHARRW